MQYKIKELFNESFLLIEGRKEDARERYPDVEQQYFDFFVEEDPSGNHKYLMWVCKVWDDMWRHSRYYENARTLMDDVNYFHENTHKYEIKDINSFNSAQHLNTATQEAKVKLTKGELKKQARKLYETATHLVVEPSTHKSSCFYGSGTRWCTTMRNTDHYFKSYTNRGSLFYFINKRNGKKRAFFTPFTNLMFGGTVKEPDYERHRGEMYTEQDNLGRSMRGIPVEARAAMANRHKELAIKKDPSIQNKIKFGQNILTRIIRGDLKLVSDVNVPNSIKKVEGNLNVNVSSLNNIKEVGGNVTLNSEVSDLGALERVGGDLIIDSYNTKIKSLKNLKYVGGNVTHSGYRGYNSRTSSLETLGDLEYVGGYFDLDFYNKITTEQLSNVNHLGSVKVSVEKMKELTSGEISLPGHPDTEIDVV
jgi:hypothetical protein